jgi:hypothetical protein
MHWNMSTLSSPVRFEKLELLFRDAAGALLDADVPFIASGSFAVWARTGTEPPMIEDIDLVVRERDIAAAARVLHGRGMRIELQPEGWLVKAFSNVTNDAGEHLFVDLIHSMSGVPVTDEVFARADTMSVTAMAVPVLAPIDMMASTLLAITPGTLDYTGVIEKARLLREQFDWDELEQRAEGTPSAMAFFDLARRFGIDPRQPHEPRAMRTPIAEHVARLSDETRRALAEFAHVPERAC